MILTKIRPDLNLSNIHDALELVKWMFKLTPIKDRLALEMLEEAPPLAQVWKRSKFR